MKIDDAGDLVASISGPVGASLPPTSPAAEHVGVLAAASCPRVTKAWTDFKGILSVHQSPEVSRKEMYSGISVLDRAQGGFRNLEISKVKAHQD